jgi:hypothetical protein
MEKEKFILTVETSLIPCRERTTLVTKLAEKIRKRMIQLNSRMISFTRKLTEVRVDQPEAIDPEVILLAKMVEFYKLGEEEVFYLTDVNENGVFGVCGRKLKCQLTG